MSNQIGVNKTMARTAPALCTNFCFVALKILCTEINDWKHALGCLKIDVGGATVMRSDAIYYQNHKKYVIFNVKNVKQYKKYLCLLNSSRKYIYSINFL